MFQMCSMSKQSIVRKLLSACECGDMSLVLYLLDIGYADVICSSQGSTPLHTALNHKHTKLAISLINMPGIDINQTDQDNRTPLHLACSHNYPNIIRALGTNTALSSESLNKKDGYGRSALMVAVEWGHLEAVKEMIKIIGVDLETVNREGETLEDVARYLKTITRYISVCLWP